MIMLDEFDMLGRMPSVTDSIKTLRAYGGHLAVVTQTIPALDKIYGEDTRLSLQGGAGVKIYLAPSEQRTKAELSAAVGKTTVQVTSKSRTIGKGPFNGINVSERHEERDLLTEDEAGRLKKDDVIILANGQHPIKVRRIEYYDDRELKSIFKAQAGPLPGPDPKDMELRSMRSELSLATSKITELAEKVDAVGAKRSRVKAALPRVVLEQIATKPSDAQPRTKSPDPDAASPKADSAAPVVLRRRDLNPLVGAGLAISTTDAAVKVMVEAAEKVGRISPDEDGYVLEAG